MRGCKYLDPSVHFVDSHSVKVARSSVTIVKVMTGSCKGGIAELQADRTSFTWFHSPSRKGAGDRNRSPRAELHGSAARIACHPGHHRNSGGTSDRGLPRCRCLCPAHETQCRRSWLETFARKLQSNQVHLHSG